MADHSCMPQCADGAWQAMLTGRPWADILATDAGTERLMERGTSEDKAQIRGYGA